MRIKGIDLPVRQIVLHAPYVIQMSLLMKRNILALSLIALSTLSFAACGSDTLNPNGALDDIDVAQLTAKKQPIINGTRVTGNEYSAAVTIYLDVYGDRSTSCTGTLIAPNYVLTASHCISNCLEENGEQDDIYSYRPYMRVGVGNSVNSLKASYKIAEFIEHPDFYCTSNKIENDIALIRLTKNVPSSVAVPVMPFTDQMELTAKEVDEDKVHGTHVGFGLTAPYDDYSSGVKFKADNTLYAVCSLFEEKSKYCPRIQKPEGFIYIDPSITNVGMCSGDSGGPFFVERDGTLYVAGVASWGTNNCMGVSAMTNVSDYFQSFILPHTNIPYEKCNNGVDDNGDGRADCDDPQCSQARVCQPEICDDKIDNNDDDLVDCDDPQCSQARVCQPEICNDGVDNNDNALVDCKDPQCTTSIYCQPEICNDKIDNNGNGLVDCDEPQCAASLYCQPEDCFNGIDDNADGLVDCDDPLCDQQIQCQPEICDDGIDNNGDGLVDCKDPQCSSVERCTIEICDDGTDNNGNGLVDCDDPQCTKEPSCMQEICDDGEDNNGDGLVDCEDPQCADSSKCEVKSDCAATPLRTQNPSIPLALALGVGLAAFVVRRRRTI